MWGLFRTRYSALPCTTSFSEYCNDYTICWLVLYRCYWPSQYFTARESGVHELFLWGGCVTCSFRKESHLWIRHLHLTISFQSEWIQELVDRCLVISRTEIVSVLSLQTNSNCQTIHFTLDCRRRAAHESSWGVITDTNILFCFWVCSGCWLIVRWWLTEYGGLCFVALVSYCGWERSRNHSVGLVRSRLVRLE